MENGRRGGARYRGGRGEPEIPKGVIHPEGALFRRARASSVRLPRDMRLGLRNLSLQNACNLRPPPVSGSVCVDVRESRLQQRFPKGAILEVRKLRSGPFEFICAARYFMRRLGIDAARDAVVKLPLEIRDGGARGRCICRLTLLRPKSVRGCCFRAMINRCDSDEFRDSQ